MTTRTNHIVRWIGRTVVLVVFGVGVVVLMRWLAGAYEPKVPVKNVAAQPQGLNVEGQLVPVRLILLPLSESAVGTIRAVHETTIGSKLLARVVEVNLKAGQKVTSRRRPGTPGRHGLAGQAPAGQGGGGVGRGRLSPGSRR